MLDKKFVAICEMYDGGGHDYVISKNNEKIHLAVCRDDWDLFFMNENGDRTISFYIPKENLPRNLGGLLNYDFDKMEDIIAKAISDTQEKYNQAYAQIDENYAEERRKYYDAENRGESDLSWVNYIKPIADALKDYDCVAVPFWIGEHSMFSVSAGDNKNVFFTTDCIENPSISWEDKEKEIKEVAIRTQSGSVNRYFVNQDFDINSLKCDRDKIKKAVTVIDNGRQRKEIKTDYEIAESTLEKLDSKYRWNDYRTVASNAPTGIAYISKDRIGDELSVKEIEEHLINELQNRFSDYLNGFLYDVICDDEYKYNLLTREETLKILEEKYGIDLYKDNTYSDIELERYEIMKEFFNGSKKDEVFKDFLGKTHDCDETRIWTEEALNSAINNILNDKLLYRKSDDDGYFDISLSELILRRDEIIDDIHSTIHSFLSDEASVDFADIIEKQNSTKKMR